MKTFLLTFIPLESVSAGERLLDRLSWGVWSGSLFLVEYFFSAKIMSRSFDLNVYHNVFLLHVGQFEYNRHGLMIGQVCSQRYRSLLGEWWYLAWCYSHYIVYMQVQRPNVLTYESSSQYSRPNFLSREDNLHNGLWTVFRVRYKL